MFQYNELLGLDAIVFKTENYSYRHYNIIPFELQLLKYYHISTKD